MISNNTSMPTTDDELQKNTVVKDSADEPSYVPVLEAAGYVLQIREPDWFEHRLFKDRIPILICMCSVWAHQRLIECCASVIGCGLMILIGTNMHKSNEACSCY